MSGHGQDGDKNGRMGYTRAASSSYSGAVVVEEFGDVGDGGETGYSVAKRKTWTYSGNQHAWNYFDMESLPTGMASNRLVFRRDSFFFTFHVTLFLYVSLFFCLSFFQCGSVVLPLSPPSYSLTI